MDRSCSPATKIALFRSLFRGRDDVYPRRFESRKTGKSGYQPACGNEWMRGVCRKPEIKCTACLNQRLLPVTDEVVSWHLTGKDEIGRDFVMGVYPMLLDETCFFLAMDFDKADWQQDVIAACFKHFGRFGIPTALERSRSGRGGHVWVFFEEAIPAALARRMGAFILTETMEQRPDIGLDSYDRFFPNQDTLPKGGFGNLIALPLQKGPREQGNSVFVDDRFQRLSGSMGISLLSAANSFGTDRGVGSYRRAKGARCRGRIFPLTRIRIMRHGPCPPSRQKKGYSHPGSTSQNPWTDDRERNLHCKGGAGSWFAKSSAAH